MHDEALRSTAAVGAMSVADWPLLAGSWPTLLVVAGDIGLGWLVIALMMRGRWGAISGCVVAAASVTGILMYLVQNVWMLFPDALDPQVYASAALTIFAVAAAGVLIAVERTPRRAILPLLAAVLAVVGSLNHINAFYLAYPTPADLFGDNNTGEVAFGSLPTAHALLPDTGPVEASWNRPSGLPAQGRLTSAPIPGTISHFPGRDAEIWLPPAYFADPRPQLPVLVLLAGQPGSPQDWLTAGRLARTMNTFAAAHSGLAPVVVVADGTGGQFDNPLCLDSRIARAATYLTVDVPAWIRAHLTVDPDPIGWAVGGLSYGGTCALQLATYRPDVYPSFLALSADAEPTLGDRHRTVAAAFGGNETAYRQVNPLELLRTRAYPGSAGAIVVGSRDTRTQREARTIHQATRAAGMDTHYTELSGGHDWHVWAAALDHELPWLASRTELLAR